jgi:thioredoxin-like negative regulator of GroEL
MLEQMLQNNLPKQPPLCMIYFTATWCGPCNGLPLDEITSLNPDIHWFICDIDQNRYSSGYCGINSVPSFMGIVNGKPVQPLSSSTPSNIAKYILQVSRLK